MEQQEMTIEELREYIKTLPEDVIVRVTVREDKDDGTENKIV